MDDVLEKFGLPGLPELADDDADETAELVLFQFDGPKIRLGDGFTVADAQEYSQRDDTHGVGWFVGYYKR